MERKNSFQVNSRILISKLFRILILFLIANIIIPFNSPAFSQETSSKDKIIFAYGGGFHRDFIKYVASLTKKTKPKICYIPTASADNARGIIRWYESCRGLEVEPYVLKVWISSYTAKKSFEEILLDMDAIIVGGGNTLNMLAIWKAQGIDKILKRAYDRGIILSGGSAGSLCWFVDGTTDSRPKRLTDIKGLGFLQYSHCPHFHTEKSRRPLYHKEILSGKFLPGYAIDNRAGIVFKNGKFFKAVSLDKKNNSYFVTVKNGKIVETKLKSEILGHQSIY